MDHFGLDGSLKFISLLEILQGHLSLSTVKTGRDDKGRQREEERGREDLEQEGKQAPEQSEKSPVREKRGRGQGRGGRRGKR
jgi:hypothetical protein